MPRSGCATFKSLQRDICAGVRIIPTLSDRPTSRRHECRVPGARLSSRFSVTSTQPFESFRHSRTGQRPGGMNAAFRCATFKSLQRDICAGVRIILTLSATPTLRRHECRVPGARLLSRFNVPLAQAFESFRRSRTCQRSGGMNAAFQNAIESSPKPRRKKNRDAANSVPGANQF